tara:strand:- start:1827 stop:2129 length:303 start_codon:yes stop_codon:yes gene_type:complete
MKRIFKFKNLKNKQTKSIFKIIMNKIGFVKIYNLDNSIKEGDILYRVLYDINNNYIETYYTKINKNGKNIQNIIVDYNDKVISNENFDPDEEICEVKLFS